MIDTGLKDRTVLITGANHGIGAATAMAFARQGAHVFITYKRLLYEGSTPSGPGEALYRTMQAKGPEDVVEAASRVGVRVAAFEADLAEPPAVPAILDRAESEIGPIDIFVNNAAHCAPDTFVPAAVSPDRLAPSSYPTRPHTWQSHDRHFAVNSRATALLIAEFTRRYLARDARWGRIVSVSTDGADCFPGEVSYGASKAALESYTRAAAAELGEYGVTANIVSLGPVQTGWITPELEARLIPHIPLRRIGRPEDVADVIVFLASEQARWVTGQTIFVGGGHRT